MSTEYHIEKYERQPNEKKAKWSQWEGPFKTEKQARKEFDVHYRNKGTAKKQDFRVVKVTIEPLPFIHKKIEHDACGK